MGQDGVGGGWDGIWCGTGRGGARWQGRGMEGGKGKDGGGMGES